MKCLLCGKRLPLLRKLQNAEFCTEEHKEQYLRQHEQLALKRLIDAQQVVRQKKKPNGTPPETEQVAGFQRFRHKWMAWAGHIRKESSEPFEAHVAMMIPRLATRRSQSQLLGSSLAFSVEAEPVRPAEPALMIPGDGAIEPSPPGTPSGLNESAGFRRSIQVQPCGSFAAGDTGGVSAPPQAGGVNLPGNWINQQAGVTTSREVAPQAVAMKHDWWPEQIPGSGLKTVNPFGEWQSSADTDRGARAGPGGIAPAPLRGVIRPLQPDAAGPEESQPMASVPVTLGIAPPALRLGPVRRAESGTLAPGTRAYVTVAAEPIEIRSKARRPESGRLTVLGAIALGGRQEIHLPPAAGNRALTAIDTSPELLAKFVVAPVVSRVARVEFAPPIPGLIGLRLYPRATDLDCWRRREDPAIIEPAPVQPVLMRASLLLLCDWIPVLAGRVALPFTAAAQSGRVTPASAPAEPEALDPLQKLVEARRPFVRAVAATITGMSRGTGKLVRIGMEKVMPHTADSRPLSVLCYEETLPGMQLRTSQIRPIPDWGMAAFDDPSMPVWRRWLAGNARSLTAMPAPVRWGGVVMSALVMAYVLLPESPVPAAAGEAAAAAVAAETSMLTRGLDGIREGIVRRAAISLADDFREGLAEWEGDADWARGWSYDAAGFVRVGSFALFGPSLALTDYRMEFLGQIERGGMGWAVRGRDRKNYYALRLAVVAEGPVPEVALVRYPVVDGVAGRQRSRRLPIEVRSDTVYKVTTEVKGPNYSVAVQGTIVDTWTDERFERGGIGFFSSKGERARVRWVGVWHQYDTLGRLCAFLAPSPMPGRERGANP